LTTQKNFTVPSPNYKPPKQQPRVFLGGHTAAMATHCATQKTRTRSPMIEQLLDTMTTPSSDKEWLQRPIQI